ncbi:cytochrome P450 [Agaricus bisporus var. bisporus H97]|uniref:cytochrome P450 n=1 Tax=Agaricus bisporus var. bisporus (strain H97 / ATCC MYA-4626 / FGSC 10389) TaxID=936046 RepID=UPI00029F6C81|nr:cytochrome P450 [Agaricus bisporus var. bisporus H97]EKV43158.1 cytochrome P450 [Agaricus bisporus var. bisporus H97]
MEWGFNFALLPYGSGWRDRRRAFQNLFHQNNVNRYLPAQLRSIRVFVRNVMESPDEFSDWIHFSTSSSIMEIIYGMKTEPGDPYVDNAEKALEGFNEAAVPGRFLIEMFPLMKHIPSWFPGAGWKRQGLNWRDNNREVRLNAFNIVKDQMNEGTAPPSACRTLIGNLPDSTAPDRVVKEDIAIDTCAVSFIGAAETSHSAARVFFMAMLLNPEGTQWTSSGSKRQPEFALHQRNGEGNTTVGLVIPLAIPHAAIDADEYNGYYIPKGTIVIGNSWTFMHDPEVYKNPHEYIPDRFLKDGKLDTSVRDPSTAIFGYGRRICPGRYFALNALFLMIAHTLAVFDIKPALDENGNEIKVENDVTGGSLSYV